MIEFIRDHKDGVWKVIEVNPRPWLFVDFFRRFGLNYLQYLHEDLHGTTAHWPALRLLDPATLAARPVHISLPDAVAPGLDALTRPAAEEDVVAFLESLPGRRTLTFLDPGDPAPGVAELEDLAARYRLKRDRLLAMVQNALSGD
jgi:predicted ATP-grasp superfamily ATP-dependent carboligase